MKTYRKLTSEEEAIGDGKVPFDASQGPYIVTYEEIPNPDPEGAAIAPLVKTTSIFPVNDFVSRRDSLLVEKNDTGSLVSFVSRRDSLLVDSGELGSQVQDIDAQLAEAEEDIRQANLVGFNL